MRYENGMTFFTLLPKTGDSASDFSSISQHTFSRVSNSIERGLNIIAIVAATQSSYTPHPMIQTGDHKHISVAKPSRSWYALDSIYTLDAGKTSGLCTPPRNIKASQTAGKDCQAAHAFYQTNAAMDWPHSTKASAAKAPRTHR